MKSIYRNIISVSVIAMVLIALTVGTTPVSELYQECNNPNNENSIFHKYFTNFVTDPGFDWHVKNFNSTYQDNICTVIVHYVESEDTTTLKIIEDSHSGSIKDSKESIDLYSEFKKLANSKPYSEQIGTFSGINIK